MLWIGVMLLCLGSGEEKSCRWPYQTDGYATERECITDLGPAITSVLETTPETEIFAAGCIRKLGDRT